MFFFRTKTPIDTHYTVRGEKGKGLPQEKKIVTAFLKYIIAIEERER